MVTTYQTAPGGSPARAGIDPCHHRVPGLRARFPRTRGDRPSLKFNTADVVLVPPHARG